MGNIKDPLKQQAKIDAERGKFSEGLSKTMSLDPAMASVCAFVGIIYDTDAQGTIEKYARIGADDGHDDLCVVENAWQTIREAWNQKMPIVSFNGIQFDLPVLQFRAICQDVPVAPGMYDQLTRRYSNMFHFDLMQILSGWNRDRWHKLEYYLQLFGLGTKGGITGADVYPMYLEGRYDEILNYCQNDVLTLCKLFARVRHWVEVKYEGA